MIRILVIGSRGRLGSMLVRHFQAEGGVDCSGLGRGDFDLARPGSFAEALDHTEFDVLVNTAAMTSVDQCESEKEIARVVNAEAPAALAAICRDRGTRMVQLSTDYVFSGREPGLRRESDQVEPLGYYGRTKAAGERAVLAADPGNLVLRTSWVFGPGRPSFPDMILDRARKGELIEAIADKWSSPTLNSDFAKWLDALVRRPGLSGIFHLCNEGECTWHDYAVEVLRLADERGCGWARREVVPIPLASMKRFSAPRPVHSAMSTERFQDRTGIRPQPWRDALAKYVGGLEFGAG